MDKVKRGLLWLTGLAAVIWMMREMRPIDGMIGHDYALHFLRFLISSADFWQNGWQLQHYTAAACGGLGVFADPQSMTFSVIQFFALYFDPWVATQLSMCLLYPAGYWFFYRLACKRFALTETSSHAGALLFTVNGFTFANLYVGHATHHSYVLLPFVLDLMLRPYRSLEQKLTGVSLLSLTLLYLLYSGSVHMLVVFCMATVLLLPYWIMSRRRTGEFRVATLSMAAVLIIFALGAAAKLYAVSSYSRLFFIRGMDLSTENPWLILWRYFYFLPGNTPLTIPWGEYMFGAWEYVGWVSKLTIPLLLVFLWTYWRRSNRAGKLVFFFTGLLALELALLGVGWGANEYLPFFRSYHNPIKLLAAFIPFLCLLAAIGLQEIQNHLARRPKTLSHVLWALLLVILAAETYSYTRFFAGNGIGTGYAYNPTLYYQARQHQRLPQIRNVVDSGNDWDTLSVASVNLKCYEPLFGYKGENKGRELIPGPVTGVRDGRFNLTHAGCLVYPEYFNCKPWDRIAVSEKDNLYNFTTGKTPTWGVPPAQQALIWLSLLTVAALVGVLIASAVRKLRKR